MLKYMGKESIFKRFPWLAHVLAMLGASIVILALVFFFLRLYARQGEEYEMPDVVGHNISEALEEDSIGLDYVVQDSVFRPGQEGGLILTQDPKGGTMVKRGRKVYLSITAYNAEDAVMPELAGLSVRQAVSELYSVGLTPGKLTFVEDPYKNSVLDQSAGGKALYAGQKVPRGTTVDLVVGLGDGSGRNSVPFVIGKTAEKARRDITALSLNVGRLHFGGVKNRNTAVVCRQEPDYNGVNKYPYGTPVELWFVDADATDVDKMVSSFKVDSSKIVPADSLPSPDEVEENSGSWLW